MKNVLLFVIVILVAANIAACVPVTPVPEAQVDVKAAETMLCASIKAFSASIDALQQVDADTTVEELDQRKDAANQSYDAMVAAWGELQEAEVQVVESAMAEFQDSITQISPESTLGEVAAEIQTSAATVKAAVDQLDQVVCIEAE
jgi:hypothetical protein